MRVEIWSPDGMEAVGQGPLTTVRAAENGPAICLHDEAMGARVWLEPDEVVWLVGQLAVLRTRILTAGPGSLAEVEATVGSQPSTAADGLTVSTSASEPGPQAGEEAR